MEDADIKKFSSRWEYSKSTSAYHFDTTINEDDNPPFQRIGRFIGDWSAELKDALEKKLKIGFSNRIYGDYSELPYTQQIELNDLDKAHLPHDFTLYERANLQRGVYPIFDKMVDYFGLVKVLYSVHIQMPGQVFLFHVDNLTKNRNNSEKTILNEHPSYASRFTVMLEDWDYGHMYGFGNTYWKQWKAGDIILHSWKDIPHGTANASLKPRFSLQITGLNTPRITEIIEAGYQEIQL